MKVLILGTFDLLHYGHIETLIRASELGTVYVGLGTDDYVTRYRGTPPIQTFKERERQLSALGYTVVARADENIVRLLNHLSPDVLACGSDWFGKDFLGLSGITIADLEERDISLLYLPRGHFMSSTELKRRISESA